MTSRLVSFGLGFLAAIAVMTLAAYIDERRQSW